MATGTVKRARGIQKGLLSNLTYGELYYVYNPSCNIITLHWHGNGTMPTTTMHYYTLPFGLSTVVTAVDGVYQGLYIQVTGSSITLALSTTTAWSAACMTFSVW